MREEKERMIIQQMKTFIFIHMGYVSLCMIRGGDYFL